jgi:4-hydroxy-tetrahydrodipicolinate reductase
MDAWNTVADACKRTNGGLFYASNFSLGVNILFYLNKQLARIMNRFNQYDVRIEEIHHTAKIDKPSGTAITLANDIIREFKAKKRWELDGASTPQSIMIQAVRKENIPGIHTVTWDSENDILQLHHSAKSRRGFALGAILAAEFMSGKKGIYGMNDLLQL